MGRWDDVQPVTNCDDPMEVARAAEEEIERLESESARAAVTNWLVMKELAEAAILACEKARVYASDHLRGQPDGITIDGKRYTAIASERGIHVGLAPWAERRGGR